MSAPQFTSELPKLWLPPSLESARSHYLKALTRATDDHGQAGYDECRAQLGRGDLYFLLRYLLKRPDIEHPWIFARCREVQASPDGHLDLWFRGGYKSTIITFALTIQDILNDPDVTFGIFSHTKSIARAFLRQIKREFETNADLKAIYPDVLWQDPKSEAPQWSEDQGIIVRRASNPKEATVEASGLVDGQPTSRHYRRRLYDDVVTLESVSSAEQIQKTTDAWELSLNLAGGEAVERYIGTRYSLYDTYASMMERGAIVPRIHAATHNGRVDGVPVFLSAEKWAEIRQKRSRTIAAQQLQNPLADGSATFRSEWLRPYDIRPKTMNVYIMGDPSKGKNKSNDSTAIAVVGVASGGARFLLDGYCHRMPQSKRWQYLRDLHRKWSRAPGVQHLAVGWERYGLQTDDEYFQEQQQREKYFFSIEELSWTREGNESKESRVERLEPDFRGGRFNLPVAVVKDGMPHVWRVTWVCVKCAHLNGLREKACARCAEEEASAFKIEYRKVQGFTRAQQNAIDGGSPELIAKALKQYDEERQIYDLTLRFIEEFEAFPFGQHDDLIDATSRLYDMEPTAPLVTKAADTEPQQYWDS